MVSGDSSWELRVPVFNAFLGLILDQFLWSFSISMYILSHYQYLEHWMPQNIPYLYDFNNYLTKILQLIFSRTFIY